MLVCGIWVVCAYIHYRQPLLSILLSILNKVCHKMYYIMAGHAIVVVKDINLLFYHGNAVILTLW